MEGVKIGDKVKIHYTKKLENGKIIETSRGGHALQIRIGSNLVPRFENAVRHMKVGDQKRITIPPEKAHGPWRKELRINLKKSELPENFLPKPGCRVIVRKKDGYRFEAKVVGLKKDTIIIDMNHPLAGKPIIVEFELIDIVRELPSQEAFVLQRRVLQ